MLLEYPCAMQRKNHYWRRGGDLYKYVVTVAIVFFIFTDIISAAPAFDNSLPQSHASAIAEYFSEINGCYYNFQRYEEGDRIVTNEPCLNCTCHNRMLMCYLRVCPFTKAIGQDCTIEKTPDQCCPIITCPEVPVTLLTSSTTSSPAPITSTTELGFRDNYGCTINNAFYADGAQVPSDVAKPCELCYCIRNRTACVMQECTLHVEGCKPVFKPGVCCPVRYECDYDRESTSTARQESTGAYGLIKSTTSSSPVDCQYGDQVFSDGEHIKTERPCEHCYCMRGDIVCAVQDCGEPLRGKDCIPTTPPPNKCCPSSYACANETTTIEEITKASDLAGTTLLQTENTYSFETTTRYKNTPVVLSQEEVYERLGEKKTSSTSAFEKSTDAPSSPSTKHPSEDIQLDDNSVDADEHSSRATTPEPSKEIPVTTNTYEKSSSEKASVGSEESQPTTRLQTEENVTPIASISKASPDIDFSQQFEATTIISSSNVAVENTSKSEFTKSPNAAADDNSYSATEVTTERIKYETTKLSEKYETTKYNEREKDSNEKLSTNAVSSSAGQDVTEAVTEEKIADQTTTPLPSLYSKLPETIEKKPIQEEQQDENSSESNKFQSTTRQFDNSTVISKEQETTKAPEETLLITTAQNDVTNPPIESEKEQQTETINTLSNESTLSLLENITKIVNSIQNSQKFPPFQVPSYETTKSPTTESATAVKVDSYPATEKSAELTTIKDEVGTVVPSVIPGEGSCLVDGITYPNTSVIESSNPCHAKCICLSSIPTCSLVTCAPPPNHPNCMPIQMKPESCCPVYLCENNEEQPSVQTPSSHNQIIPDEPEPSLPIFGSDETTIVNGYEFSTRATDYNKPAETITEKSKPESDIESKPEVTTLFDNKIENEVTEGQKVVYSVTEISSKASIASETPKPEPENPEPTSPEPPSPEPPTTLPPAVIRDKIDELTTLSEVVSGSTTTPKETITEEIVTENANKLESEDLHKATTVKELPSEGPSSTEPPTTLASVSEKTEKTPYHDDTSENEVHSDDNGAVSDDAYTTIAPEVTSEYSPVTKQSTEKYSDATQSAEPQYQEKETESSEKATTTESGNQFINPIPPSTESKEEIQKYSTEEPLATEPSPTVYIDEKIDINPTTLATKISDEQNDAGTEYSISSSTAANPDYSQNPEEFVTTTELPIVDSQSTAGVAYSSTPEAEINTEVQSDQTTKGYETYSSTEISLTSERNKQESEYVTTLKSDLDNEISQVEVTTVGVLNENNAVNSESTTASDTSYSIANEYTSEFYSSSYPTTEKGLELDITERISNSPEQSASSQNVPTTTVESETVILNENYHPVTETTESANANEAYQPSSSPQYDVETTAHDSLEGDKHTGSGQVVTDESSNSVTINPAYDEGIKENEEVKPITVLPETNDYPSVTVLPSKTTYPTLPPIFHEGVQTEISVEAHSSSSSSSQPDEVQTRIPETNDIPQQPDSGSQKVETPSTERVESHVTEAPSQEPSYPPSTEKQASAIPSLTSTQSTPNFFDTSSEVSHPGIQHSTWTHKPYDEETSEPNYYPPAPMYPTGGGDSVPENGSEESEYEDSSAFGPGTCRYGGKIYVSAQQIPRDDPCDFCFCFRSDIICLQQSCPPPIQGCRQEPISGFCCPRYECPVATALMYNATTTTSTTTTSTTTTLPPHFPLESYRGHARRVGCMIHGYFYKVGDDIAIASGPCLECICGSDGRMKCDPKSCSPEPFVRSFMGEATSKR